MAITDRPLTLDTTWSIQIKTDRGWVWVSQAEYDSEEDIHELGAGMYGGTCVYRTVRIDRTVGEPMWLVNPKVGTGTPESV